MAEAPLDEGRLALEKWKAEQDVELRRRELEQRARDGGWLSKISPLTTTIMAGVLTLAASAVATILQGRNTLDLEEPRPPPVRRSGT